MEPIPDSPEKPPVFDSPARTDCLLEGMHFDAASSRSTVRCGIMMSRPQPIGNLEHALDAAAKGYVPIPCIEKVPCVKWKQWQSAMPSEELIREWFADTRRNLAI